MFEETTETLFGSDLLHQNGDVEALTTHDVIDRSRATLVAYQASPLANYMPYTPQTGAILEGLAALKPKRIATMHGSVYEGDGARALRDFAGVMRDVFGPQH